MIYVFICRGQRYQFEYVFLVCNDSIIENHFFSSRDPILTRVKMKKAYIIVLNICLVWTRIILSVLFSVHTLYYQEDPSLNGCQEMCPLMTQGT